MADQRSAEVRRTCIEQLRQRGPGWVTSRELACEVGYKSWDVAWALVKMAADAQIERRSTTWVSNRHRTRHCYEYRLVEIKAAYPAWLMPQATDIAIGVGRVVLMEK